MTERIADERLEAVRAMYAAWGVEMSSNYPGYQEACAEVAGALAELQERRVRDESVDGHGLPTRLGAAIKFEGLANVFVRHSTYQPYPWTDGQAFLDSEEVLEIGEGCGPWKVVQDD